MKLRLLTVVAIALVTFYAGVLVDAHRSADESLAVAPQSLPITITAIPTDARTVHAFTIQSQSDPDPLLTGAGIAAIVAALFLLARLSVMVVRRTRAARQPA